MGQLSGFFSFLLRPSSSENDAIRAVTNRGRCPSPGQIAQLIWQPDRVPTLPLESRRRGAATNLKYAFEGPCAKPEGWKAMLKDSADGNSEPLWVCWAKSPNPTFAPSGPLAGRVAFLDIIIHMVKFPRVGGAPFRLSESKPAFSCINHGLTPLKAGESTQRNKE